MHSTETAIRAIFGTAACAIAVTLTTLVIVDLWSQWVEALQIAEVFTAGLRSM
jgi:hypothetical protein